MSIVPLHLVDAPERSNIFDNSFEILGAIGRGRNSVVYRARPIGPKPIDVRGPQDFLALKVLLGNAKHPEINRERMRHESLAMLAARHRNVVRLYDFIETSDLCYMVMEYVDGGDLWQLLQRTEGCLNSYTVLRYIIQVLDGLEQVHRAGIVHCDIKPENLLLTSEGTIKIADFGVAKLPTDHTPIEQFRQAVGTFDYLAPECLERGQTGPSTDVYSVGVACYQLLTQHMPFGGESLASHIENKMTGRRLPLGTYLRNYPLSLEEVLTHALHADPNQRFAGPAEFRTALERVIDRSKRSQTKSRSVLENVALGDPQSKPTESEQLKGQNRLLSQMAPHVIPAPFTQRVIDWVWANKRKVILAVAAVVLTFGVVWGVSKIRRYYQTTSSLGVIEERAPINIRVSSLLNQFTKTFRTGMLYSYLGPDNDVSVVLSPGDERRADLIVSLGIPGFAAQRVNLDAFLTTGSFELTGGGVRLTMSIDENRVSADKIEGNYVDELTGRTGRWAMW